MLITLRGVGIHIECGCPLLAFGHALSLSPKMGSGEADMVARGRGSLRRGGESLERATYSR
jgi:hypothetical protein